MDAAQYTEALNDRLRRYGATPLDATKVIAITADPAYLATYDGQVAALVAANLLGRMSPSVILGFDDRALDALLPWSGASLHEVALQSMRGANPYGTYEARAWSNGDYQ